MPSSLAPSSAFATAIGPLYFPGFERTQNSLTSILTNFLCSVRTSNVPEVLQDFVFDVIFNRLLQPAVSEGIYPLDMARSFVNEYSIMSRSRRADALSSAIVRAESDYTAANEYTSSLRAAAPTSHKPDPSYVSRLSAADSSRCLAEITRDATKDLWQRAEAERSYSVFPCPLFPRADHSSDLDRGAVCRTGII